VACSVLFSMAVLSVELLGDVFWYEESALVSSVLAFLVGVGGSSCRSVWFAGCSGGVVLKIETTLNLHCSIPP